MAAASAAKIVVQMADGKTREYELGEEVMHIGRDTSCQIYIPSRFVSRRHAMISLADDGFVIRNESSTNPLHINGRIVQDPHTLASGDRVQLGDTVLTFEEVSDDPFATAIYGMTPIVVPPQTSEPQPQSLATPRGSGDSPRRGSRPPGTWTILFTDLVDHTRQVTRMGDVAGQRWLHTYISILRQQFEIHDGWEGKWTGDGFLVTFASARRAVQCAVGIQRGLRDYNREHPAAEIHARIGVNTGEILKEEDELFGSAVILAARVMSKAVADEILLSELMYRLVQATGEFSIVERGSFTLKGFPQRQRLYEVKWQEGEQHTLTGS
ncbi:MAG: FHA domain-containing protein [Dehalococcoidia bacterium]